MRTDFHTHVYTPAIAAKAVSRLAAMGFATPGSGLVEDLLQRAHTAGLERVVCLGVALTGHQVPAVNAYVLHLARRQRACLAEPAVTAFAGIHPEYPKWPEELDRLESEGIQGLKIHPTFQNLPLDDPRLFPVLEAVGERFIVLCHMGNEVVHGRQPSSPGHLAKLCVMFPKVRFVAAHLGGCEGDCSTLAGVLGRENLWMDTANTAQTGRDAIQYVLRHHPFERLLFGSDYPLFDPAVSLAEQQRRFAFSDTQMDALLCHAGQLLRGENRPCPAHTGVPQDTESLVRTVLEVERP